MCSFRRVLEPSEKLSKFIGLGKILFLINLIITLSHIIGIDFNIFLEGLCCIFLLSAVNSVYFLYAGLYIIIASYLIILNIMDIGVSFQYYIFGKSGSSTEASEYYLLITKTIGLIFYVFAVFVLFPIYREMKAQHMEDIGMLQIRNENNSLNIPNNSEPSV